MKRLKFMIMFFALSAVTLTCVMCSMITYTYCDMTYAIEFRGASAPASIALFYLIPFVPAIIICVVCAFVSHRKYVLFHITRND